MTARKAGYSIVRFSSADLAEADRIPYFRDVCGRKLGGIDVQALGERPFHAEATLRDLPGLGIASTVQSPQRVERTRELLADGNGDLLLAISKSGTDFCSQGRGEAIISGGEALLLSNGDPYCSDTPEGSCFLGLKLGRASLAQLVPGVEDAFMRPVRRDNQALRLLVGYLGVLDANGALATPELQRSVVTHVYDLVALALGPGRDAAEIASRRGVRAARLREAIAGIRTGYADPAFSAQDIARKLGVSPRYVQDLLQETGSSFTARVIELRLQRAREMLLDARHDRLKVGEIAAACGFNEIPYFNRCFRRRFGASPTQYRGGAASQD
jgi:AraC-like DNA-binding protein